MDDVSRRRFLQASAIAAGGLLSPSAKAILLEPQSQSVPSKPVGPNDRIRFGIIGIGMQGSNLLASALSIPGTECVAAADLYEGRHLLAQAVNRTEAPDQLAAIDRDDLPRGEELLQHGHGPLVVHVFENGKQDDAIADVEIRVARREALAVPHDLARHRERVNRKSDFPVNPGCRRIICAKCVKQGSRKRR